jgi:hypothetical protein
LDQTNFDENDKLINYHEQFHTFIKLIFYIFRAYDKEVYRKEFAQVFKFEALVGGSAIAHCHLQRVSVVKDVHSVTVTVKNKW